MAYENTNKGNAVAVVSDGTRVLGLGDIGPVAGPPVMEGKAPPFKYLGGVDAVPICLDTKDPYRITLAVRLIQPSFGGINLEDISQSRCLRVLDMLRTDPEIKIPVWHDDQQGTATVILAGVINALKVVGKRREDIKVTLIGAANVLTLRRLLATGVRFGSVIACDSAGILHPVEGEDSRPKNSELVRQWVDCGQDGQIVVDVHCATSWPGVFSASDVTRVSEQALVHIGEGPGSHLGSLLPADALGCLLGAVVGHGLPRPSVDKAAAKNWATG